jgi:uncharacterized protein (UPF0333 family)
MNRKLSISNRGGISPVTAMFLTVVILAVIISVAGMFFLDDASVTSPENSAHAVYNDDANTLYITTNQEYNSLQYKLDSNDWRDVQLNATNTDSEQSFEYRVELESQPSDTITVRGKVTPESNWQTLKLLTID